nr:hypothetical protein [Tanacetum cinerariifolium]
MGERESDTWVWRHRVTWNVRVRSGTVPVRCSVQERAVGEDSVLAGELEMPMVLSLAWETILKIEHAFEDKHCQPRDILELFRRLHNDGKNIHEELAVYINTPSWDRPTICYNDDDDEDCTIVITPIILTKDPDNSLSMGDEHLDTISETKSDELIKSSVENLVPIPSESEGIPENMCDVPFHDNSPPLDISKDQFEDFFDSNDDSTLIDDDSFFIDDIKYVVASPPDSELVSSEVMEIVIPEIGGIDEMPMVLSLAWETILEIEHAFEDKHCQPGDILELFRRLHNDGKNIHKELAVYINTPGWDRPTICYNDDDDEDCTIAITPIILTEDPDNSQSMGDEHLDTISETKSDELIKSSVENLVPIPSESEGIPENMCDVPFHDKSPPLDISKDQFEDFFDSNDDSTLIDDDSFFIDDIKYVLASPPDSELVSSEVMEIVIPEIGGIDVDILFTI